MMSEITIVQIAEEPEETAEASLCALLSSVCSIPVEGALTPVTEGTAKRLTSDTFVSVMVDLASQDLDLARPAQFLTMSASVSVHYALADDADGSSFRDECRKVRAALVSLTGDGCATLSSGSLAADGFVLASTSTTFDAGDNPTNVKTYTATITCRVIAPTTNTNNEQEATNG